MFNKFQQRFWPNICCLCENTSDLSLDLCNLCYKLLPWAEDRCCRCGINLEALESITCEKCRCQPPLFDRLFSLFSYELPITKLIADFKYKGNLAYGKVLGELLAEKVMQTWYKNEDLPECLIPLPLHEERLRKRGFNQALELLWPIHKKIKIPLLLNHCKRIVKKKPQSTLNRSQRKQNMQGVFKICSELTYKHVAIVDDVVTTGSTVGSLSYILKEVGVELIDVWCIGRS